MTRLNKYLARCGACSRRKADEEIKSGKVKVNGKIVREPFYNVSNEDSVYYKGKILKEKKLIYLCLNKPSGYVSTVKDRHAEKKVVDLIPGKYGRVFPVGRLDKDATGLLILTNDGNFANLIMHPRYQIEKEYEVVVDGILEKRDMEKARSGIIDEGEKLKIIKGKIIKKMRNKTKIRITLKEGKKREIKRIFGVLGYNVLQIKRIRIGSIKLGNLKEGEYREITADEILYFTGGS